MVNTEITEITETQRSRSPAILVLTGASGAGKTTLTLKLNDLAIPGVKGFNCDRVKIEEASTDRQADTLLYCNDPIDKSLVELELLVRDLLTRARSG